jgi:glycosyltransferase involved in cell wall biosynthesis
MTTLSIALATYNGQRYLHTQLESLRKQTVPPIELVVSDDASTDHTVATLRKFSADAPFPVRISKNQKRVGYRINFVRAASACTGELIAFCDQDDIWRPQKLELSKKAFADPEILLAYHNALLIDSSGGGIRRLFAGKSAVFPPLSTRPWLIVPGMVQVMRRSLTRFDVLHEHSIDPYKPEQKMSHDIWYPFWASVLGKILRNAKALVEYRQHEESTSGWHLRWADHLRDSIFNAEQYAAANVTSSSNRLELLERARTLVEPAELPRIDAAVAYYAKLDSFNQRRLDIYREPSRSERARSLYELYRAGAYDRASICSLGYDTLFLDAMFGVGTRRFGRLEQPVN